MEVVIAHIPDGVLSTPVLVGGAVTAGAATVYALRSMEFEAVPKVAMLTAMFFVASLVNVPVGPSSAHLILAGLMGVVLGWATVPAVLVGLILQAVLFGFGGLTTLGVNTMNIALPAVLWSILLGPVLRRAATPARMAAVAGIISALSVITTGLLVTAALVLTDADYLASARLILVTYLPLAAVEGLVVAAAVGFLTRVKPEALARGATIRG